MLIVEKRADFSLSAPAPNADASPSEMVAAKPFGSSFSSSTELENEKEVSEYENESRRKSRTKSV